MTWLCLSQVFSFAEFVRLTRGGRDAGGSWLAGSLARIRPRGDSPSPFDMFRPKRVKYPVLRVTTARSTRVNRFECDLLYFWESFTCTECVSKCVRKTWLTEGQMHLYDPV